MFTGYKSDGTDAFSIVVLQPIAAGTVLRFTDRGWDVGDGGFDTSEGILTFTFGRDFSCGEEILFEDGGWSASDINGLSAGSVSESGSFSLSTSGDQIFAYESPTPTTGNESAFVAAIQMNGNWDNDVGGGNANNESERPSTFNGSGSAYAIVFNNEYDNAKYDCSTNSGSAATIINALDNDSNWDVSNSSSNIDLEEFCNFCCGSPESITLSGPSSVDANSTFTLFVTGTLGSGESWQLYTGSCNSGSPVQTTMADSFIITAPGSAGTYTYYVNSSGADCPGQCTSITICVDDLYSTCTNCSSSLDLSDCGDCHLPDPAANPPLMANCDDIRIVFLLDESGSLSGSRMDVENGVLSFVNALNGSGAQLAIIEFSTYASLVTGYTPMNSALVNNVQNYFNGIPFNGRTYFPSGGTNWHDAIDLAASLTQPDLIIFFTDGEPNYYGTSFIYSCDYAPSIVNPVKISNQLKNAGTHIFMLGVGNNINNTNLQRMSGPTQYMAGTNTVGTSDWTIENFDNLAECLEDFAFEICATTITLEKSIIDTVCLGDTVNFRFIVENTGMVNDAEMLVVKDTFPSGYTAISYSGVQTVCIGSSCVPSQPDNTFCWSVGNLQPGYSDTLFIKAVIQSTSNLINTAWATSTTADTVSSTITAIPIDTTPPLINCSPSCLNMEQSPLNGEDCTSCSTSISGNGNVTIGSGMKVCVLAGNTFTGSVTVNNGGTLVVCGNLSPSSLTINAGTVILLGTASFNNINFNSSSSLFKNYGTVSFQNLTCQGTIENHGILTTTGNTNINTSSSVFLNTGNASFGNNLIVNGAFTNHGSIYVDHNMNGNGQSSIQNYCEMDIDNNFSLSNNFLNNGTISVGATLTLQNGSSAMFGNKSSIVSLNGVFNGSVSVSGCSSISVNYSELNSSLFISGDLRICDANGVFDVNNYSPGYSVNCVTCTIDSVLTCGSDTSVSALGMPSVTDDFDPNPTVYYQDILTPGCINGLSSFIRRWYAIDACGNIDSCDQVFQIIDTIPPVISPPLDTIVDCDGSGNIADFDTWTGNHGGATATDDCDSLVWSFEVINSVFGCGLSRTDSVIFIATDACGNADTVSAHFVVQDTTTPVITCPVDVTLDCPADTSVTNTGLATATEECSSMTISYSNAITPDCGSTYTITRTWLAVDACGNSARCEQTITVQDTTAPVITCPADVTLDCPADTSVTNTGLATATDNCSSIAITYSNAVTPDCGNTYTITRTWLAVDACGNSARCAQTITVQDTTAPVITCPADVTLDCPARSEERRVGKECRSRWSPYH